MALVYSVPLPKNWEAPDLDLKGTDDKSYSLNDFTDKKGLLVIFTCNHCPYAKAAWPVTIDLYKKFGEKIAFVAINPNDATLYPEDSFDEMKKKAEEWGIPFPYLRDETQKVTENYQAQCTPDIYLFKNENEKFTLFYHGCINDNWQNPDEAQEENLKDALDSLVQDQPVPEPQPPSMGCSIKWK